MYGVGFNRDSNLINKVYTDLYMQMYSLKKLKKINRNLFEYKINYHTFANS
jgi:hypothetical protein